jgi:SAM-dependent methyltransferase
MSRPHLCPAAGAFKVDDQGFSFCAEDGEVLDVLFDDRRVWSLVTDEFPPDRSAVRRAQWPEPIRRHLDGVASVELRGHVAGTSLGVAEVRFGSGLGRVDIVDASGRPVALTKWGKLNHPFDTSDRTAVEGYLDQVEAVLEILRTETGRPAFLAFGSLLGAVRAGKLIGHDVDVDLGYFSEFNHPADVIREGFRIERVLRSKGYDPVRENGGFLALFLPQLDGTRRNLDIFTTFCRDGMLYQVHDVAVEGSQADVLPLQIVEFEGRDMPVPAKPEVFLRAAYGPDWPIPNPAFEFTTPRSDRRRIGGWFGGLRERRDFWRHQYASDSGRIPGHPSSLATWVAGKEPPGKLVDVGCGNGRDTRFFADLGFDVTGLDLLPNASRRLLEGMEPGKRPEVKPFNLESLRQTLATAAQFSFSPDPVTVYGRFLLHALSDSARRNFWRFTSMALRSGGRCYLEFRTEQDALRRKAFGEHYRRYLDPALVVAEAAASGYRVLHMERALGLSPYEDEDPHLCRMILEWNR